MSMQQKLASSKINQSWISSDISHNSSSTSSQFMVGSLSSMHVVDAHGCREQIDFNRIRAAIEWAVKGYESAVSVDTILQESVKLLFDGISKTEVADALVLGTIAFIERDFAYGYVAARLLFKKQYREVTNTSVLRSDVTASYRASFISAIKTAVADKILTPEMADFDLERLAAHMVLERDGLFDFMGLRTLNERYFLRTEQRTILELPQAFWMRVAMGVCLQEGEHKNERALEFYDVMSQMRYVPSTPTLLHSGLTRAQLSSCFLGTVADDLHNIFKSVSDQAQLAKWSGGVAYDWTNIRATGSMIKSIKTESQGVIPFLKISNDTTAAINRSGKRRSASVVYLESWHLEVEDFLDLRRNTGDERRRTHDINTANWVPDLFMKRVIEDSTWSLFSPHEAPDLHDLYGKAFEEAYCRYEAKGIRGELEQYKSMPARDLWKKMLSRLFETGHPWITFKDACNIRSPQDHVGVVHSSNLCTEITLNTSVNEVAVCNIGSVNLAVHFNNGTLDKKLLVETVNTAMRLLDNVIDINFYPIVEAQNSNMRHRPVGIGMMGFQDALYQSDIEFGHPDALIFADEVMELISHTAIMASSQLAAERGTYQTYKGSKWDRNIFPQDTVEMLAQERNYPIDIDMVSRLNWTPVREHVSKHGMRNSNVMAIAPTATISNISGCFPCIEPIYKNMYVKSNMSGEFTVVNKYLIDELKSLGLWDQDMLDQIKYYDGSIQQITSIPEHIRGKYKEAFEIDPVWLLTITAHRMKWIDQSQSHNVFMAGVSGKKLQEIYETAWKLGLKTTYYLRTMGASQIEKSTLDAKKFGYTQKRDYRDFASAEQPASVTQEVTPAESAVTPVDPMITGKACSLSADPECEVCQ